MNRARRPDRGPRRPTALGLTLLRVILVFALLGVASAGLGGCSASNNLGEELSFDPSDGSSTGSSSSTT